MLKNCFIKMHDVDIAVLCETSDQRIAMAKEVFVENEKPIPKITNRFDDIITDPEIDAVVIMTGWDSRPQMAKKAMLAGKYTAIEVGCSETLLSLLRRKDLTQPSTQVLAFFRASSQMHRLRARRLFPVQTPSGSTIPSASP